MNQERIAMEKAVGNRREVPMSQVEEDVQNLLIGGRWGLGLGVMFWVIMILLVIL